MAETPPPVFRMLKILHTALVLGMLFFTTIVFFLVKSGIFPSIVDLSLDRTLQVVAILLSTLMVFIGFRMFSNRTMTIRNSTDTDKIKMDKYKSGCIIWWAMIEGPGLFAFVCFLLIHNYAFLVLGCLHLLILALFTPKWSNIRILLNFGSDDWNTTVEKKQ